MSPTQLSKLLLKVTIQHAIVLITDFFRLQIASISLCQDSCFAIFTFIDSKIPAASNKHPMVGCSAELRPGPGDQIYHIIPTTECKLI